MHKHCEAIGRPVHVFNLDPAAEHFDYPVSWDIRSVVSIDDVTETLGFGPNGGLIYCMEYLAANLEVLSEELGAYECTPSRPPAGGASLMCARGRDDYIIFDCPGQIELYTHIPVMRKVVQFLAEMGYRVAGVYLLDAQFLDDPAKYFSGVLSALSARGAPAPAASPGRALTAAAGDGDAGDSARQHYDQNGLGGGGPPAHRD